MNMSPLLLVVAALGATACGTFDYASECRSYCEDALREGCFPVETDCEVTCDSAEASYESARDEARSVGCAREYDAFIACDLSASACLTEDEFGAVCGDEIDAFNRCIVRP